MSDSTQSSTTRLPIIVNAGYAEDSLIMTIGRDGIYSELSIAQLDNLILKLQREREIMACIQSIEADLAAGKIQHEWSEVKNPAPGPWEESEAESVIDRPKYQISYKSDTLRRFYDAPDGLICQHESLEVKEISITLFLPNGDMEESRVFFLPSEILKDDSHVWQHRLAARTAKALSI
jgi:hypothetical protein